LLAEVAKYGTAHVKRAYGDWTGTSLKDWKDQLLAQSIQPIQQFAYPTGKNATDAAMVIDAMDLLYSGPLRRVLAVLRAEDARFEFTDPQFRNSLAITLAFAATGSRPTAVLTGPRQRIGAGPGLTRPHPAGGADTHDMVRVRVARHRLAATAGLVWSGDPPRPLQHVLFDTADGIGFDPQPSAAQNHQTPPSRP